MAQSRPSGTVTFLFTDIEGSTKIAQQYPDQWIQLRHRHDELMQAGVAARDGFVFQIVGDQFCAAFHTAADAVSAAAGIQLALEREPWSPVPIKVRMGLHSGSARTGPMDDRSGGYTGYSALASTQRVMSTAHGGQILLSNTTAELVRADMPAEIHLIDMGEHRLKGLANAQHLWQVYADGLGREFPALRSLNAIPNNLPIQLTDFIGRQQAVADLETQLNDHRLLTLTGPGGTGKTRLALRLAAEVIDRFADGVWFIELAPIAEAKLIPELVASVLGVREQAGVPIQQVLKNHVKDRRSLLILDNCEHLLGASASLADDLLRSGPEVKILATSREPLRVGGERVYAVPPLSFPDPAQVSSVGDLAPYEALRLFIDRALDAQPAFRVDDQNASLVAGICRKLDGIPLAIELAAARTRSMSIETLAQRLDDRFRLLTSGPRTAEPRQQTLRALLDWSYDLLAEPERRLLGSFSVFRGGWSLESAEAVVADDEVDEADVLDLLGSLVDKSLVAMGASGTRYDLLETVRQYASQKLAGTGEEEKLHERHAIYFAEFAEAAVPHLMAEDQAEWLERLDDEHDNLRAALSWSLAGDRDLNLALRIVSASAPFWVFRGFLREGSDNASSVLARIGDDADLTLRTAVTLAAARLAYRQNLLDESGRYYREGLDLARQLGDRMLIAEGLEGLGNVDTEVGDYQSAPLKFQEALELHRQIKDPLGIASANMNLAWASIRTGDLDTAEAFLLEALEVHEKARNRYGLGFVLSGLGEVYLRQGKLEQAQGTLERSLQARQALGDKWGMGATLGSLGWVHLSKGDFGQAERALGQSLSLRRDIGDTGGTAWCLEKLAQTAVEAGDAQRAVRLYGKAHALRKSIQSVVDPVDQPAYETRLDKLSADLGPDRFDALWKEGAAAPIARLASLETLPPDG